MRKTPAAGTTALVSASRTEQIFLELYSRGSGYRSPFCCLLSTVAKRQPQAVEEKAPWGQRGLCSWGDDGIGAIRALNRMAFSRRFVLPDGVAGTVPVPVVSSGAGRQRRALDVR